MWQLVGISASPGIGIAAPYFFSSFKHADIPTRTIPANKIEAEWQRLSISLQKSRQEIKELAGNARAGSFADDNDQHQRIIETQGFMLEDFEFISAIETMLHEKKVNIEKVLLDVSSELASKVRQSNDPAHRERAHDIEDITFRLLENLPGNGKSADRNLPPRDMIVVSGNVMPSDFISFDKKWIKGIVTEVGGRTSHLAILARASEIPAVLGVKNAMTTIKGASLLLINGDLGTITIDPTEAELAHSSETRLKHTTRSRKFLEDSQRAAATTDGRSIQVFANIGKVEEAGIAVSKGADGVGLFRTEFLFNGSALPDEEEQFEAYCEVIARMKGKPVTIRTFDLGGDKVFPGMEESHEKNPLLGQRAIRFSLAHRRMFRAQLRAILRASTKGPVKIMFPMIASFEELEDALAAIGDAQEELTAEGLAFDAHTPAGIMIEVPSAAITSDILARRAAFFSIGTNDLLQYTFAADRENELVNNLKNPYSPAILKLIRMTAESALGARIPISVCGELAADPYFAVIFIGLGIAELSMTAASIPEIKHIIRETSYSAAKGIAYNVMGMDTSKEIFGYLKSCLGTHESSLL